MTEPSLSINNAQTLTPTATPFQIHVSDDILRITKQKLELARLPDQLENLNWEGPTLLLLLLLLLLFSHAPKYRNSLSDNTLDGAPVSEIERLVNHWQKHYDWRIHEAKINELPQFTMPIEVSDFGELTVHFVHKKAVSDDNAIPLIFIHGWPGSFLEVQKILPLLTEPENGKQAFHVVAPRYFRLYSAY